MNRIDIFVSFENRMAAFIARHSSLVDVVDVVVDVMDAELWFNNYLLHKVD